MATGIVRGWRSATLMGVFAAVSGALGGCSNPRFKGQQAVRDARMHRYLTSYVGYDAEGRERIDETLTLHRKLNTHHAQQLDDTTRLVGDSYRRRQHRWEDQRPRRRAFVKEQLRGQPEQIDDTFARMFY